MAAVTVHGLTAAQKHMADRARRVRDLTPAMKVIGQDVVAETMRALQLSKSPAGEQWSDIKDSTKLGRQGVRARANKRGKKGLTATAKKFRAALLAPGGAKPLVDTGRLRNSAHTVANRRSVRFTMVGYAGPHITGSQKGNLPKRNPTVFEYGSGQWRLVPRLRTKYARMLIEWIERGRA